MTIKRCNSCGKPFSNKTSKYSRFCSEPCKDRYYSLLNDTSRSESLIESDLKLKQKAEANDRKRRKRIV